MKNLLPTQNAVQVLYMALALRFRQLPVTSSQLLVTSQQSKEDLVTSGSSRMSWGTAGQHSIYKK